MVAGSLAQDAVMMPYLVHFDRSKTLRSYPINIAEPVLEGTLLYKVLTESRWNTLENI